MKFSIAALLLPPSAVIATATLVSSQAPCPDPWAVNTVYAGDEEVGANGRVYKCKAWPFSGLCGQAGFEPSLNPIGLAPAWTMAWTDEGSCDGATPTPVQPYESNARYEYGDVVTNQDKQWRCKAVWPDTFRCGQAGYAPGEPYNGVALYEDVWEEAFMPTVSPSYKPSSSPSAAPSNAPSTIPSTSPSVVPSGVPSSSPSAAPSNVPSYKPSSSPSAAPSNAPSTIPSASPSTVPSGVPSSSPSEKPSSSPSAAPSNVPSTTPSASPSAVPSDVPSSSPSVARSPSAAPSDFPSGSPSNGPSSSLPLPCKDGEGPSKPCSYTHLYHGGCGIYGSVPVVECWSAHTVQECANRCASLPGCKGFYVGNGSDKTGSGACLAMTGDGCESAQDGNLAWNFYLIDSCTPIDSSCAVTC